MGGLYDALRGFDGKALTLLSEARAKFGNDPNFIDELIHLVADEDENISSGASWLVKSQIENGIRLDAQQSAALFDNLAKSNSWMTSLHICQVFEHLHLEEEQAQMVADWLFALTASKRPFLRAWSMNALQHLAHQYEVYRPLAVKALVAAENDQAASVRARARQWQNNK